MQFNSQLYLVFLVVAVLGSWALARRGALRLTFLLVASWLFYMSWDWRFIALIVGSTVLDFVAAGRIEAAAPTARRRRKAWLAASLAGNLGALFYFKYTNFFVQSAADAARSVGMEITWPVFDIILPAGISFYTFQTLSYTIDVYRGQLKAERSLLRFSLFVAYFPQLVAGPIVRAVDFLPQYDHPPRLTRDEVGESLFRIARGLVKKIVVADHLAVNLVDRCFSQPELYTSTELMVALYAYTMQIYCDFSGYSDIAIGSARLMGFRLPENFDRPYAATSVAGFWRRWHITLSQWLRSYVFLPLGGSKGPPWRAHVNTMITLLLIGLWHGASWTFVAYGGLHGVAISINRILNRAGLTPKDPYARPWWEVAWKVALTFHFIVLARILFRAHSWDVAGAYTRALLGNGGVGVAQVAGVTWAILAGAYLIHWTPRRWLDGAGERFAALPAWAQGGALAALSVGVGAVAETEIVPFIYFQF